MKTFYKNNPFIRRRMLEVVLPWYFTEIWRSEENVVTSTRGCRANNSRLLKMEYQISSRHSLWFVDV